MLRSGCRWQYSIQPTEVQVCDREMVSGAIGKRMTKESGRLDPPVSRLRMCTKLYPPSMTSVPSTLETSAEDKISVGLETEAKNFFADSGMLAGTRGLNGEGMS